jgi:hypothetical protein
LGQWDVLREQRNAAEDEQNCQGGRNSAAKPRASNGIPLHKSVSSERGYGFELIGNERGAGQRGR